MNTINLSGQWKLKAGRVEKNNYGIKNGNTFDMDIPGSVQDTLIEQMIVPDPYYAKNELETMFIGRSDWNISKRFSIAKDSHKYILKLEKVDTIACLKINGKHIKNFDNEHEIHFIDITDALKNGNNVIEFDFTASEKIAIERNNQLKYPIPCSRYMHDSPNRNLVRKAQCNAAWDWGLCLQTIGIYEPVIIYECDNYILKSFSAIPVLSKKKWVLQTESYIEAFSKCKTKVSASVAGFSSECEVDLNKGINRVPLEVIIPEDSVEKWWPNGYGKQPLYEVQLSTGEFKLSREIGFRTITVKNNTTYGGKELTVCINGKSIFCKGANWIPLDARPGRMSEERYDEIIKSAKDANMNMLRVWGGGWYEKEEFYNACDKYGILLWHDLMFSCSTYPTEQWFLESVERELRDQIRRLKSRTCIAIWCGNNECLGALGWYEETIANREIYLKDYEKLYTNWIDNILTEEDKTRMYWPSSPCAGPGDYSDNWHSDGNGDMHFWTVWHERKDFEEYHKVKPRFCSEFGYQSFPSYSEVQSFAPDDQLNLTSPVMEHHQRNLEGNSIIIEMFTRYFRMPCGFANQLYLSQVQQALAIETAVTYWRSLTPYCTGTLFWQLNDVWPVSSWSSIEYSGKWKALQYSARRFYSSLAPLVYSDNGIVSFKVVNDGLETKKTSASFKVVRFDGTVVKNMKKTVEVDRMSTAKIEQIKTGDFDADDCFVVACAGNVEQTILLCRPKDAKLLNPEISVTAVKKSEEGFSVTLKSTNPAFFVMLDAGSVKGIFDDNNFCLLGKKTVLFKTDVKMRAETFAKQLRIFDLYSSYQEKK